MDSPSTYFLTFTSYGTWLPGDERGSVERLRRPARTEPIEVDAARRDRARSRMTGAPVYLNEAMRQAVSDSVVSVCEFKGWTLHSVNVRTNHVHVVVSAEAKPEPVMNTFKAWSTRRLREAGLVGPDDKVWTRHGSTRPLNDERAFAAVQAYVIEGQGDDIGGLRLGGDDRV